MGDRGGRMARLDARDEAAPARRARGPRRAWGALRRGLVAAAVVVLACVVGAAALSAQPRRSGAPQVEAGGLPHAPRLGPLPTGGRADLRRAAQALEARDWGRAARAFAQADRALQREAARVFGATGVGPERGSGPIGPFMDRYVRGASPVLRVAAGRFYLDAALYRAWVWACAEGGDVRGAQRAMIALLVSGRSDADDRANAAALAARAPSEALARALKRATPPAAGGP